MKRFHKIVAAAVAIISISAMSSGSASALKAGDACSKSQLNKKSGALVCTYDAKTKKYTWVSSASAAAV